MNKEDEALLEFKEVSNGLYPSNSRVLQEFSNGIDKVINHSWEASNGVTVLFVVTYIDKGLHDVEISYVYA